MQMRKRQKERDEILEESMLSRVDGGTIRKSIWIYRERMRRRDHVKMGATSAIRRDAPK